MEGVISYRPSIGKKKLIQAVEKTPFDNTNQFIDFAVMNTLVSRGNPKVLKLMAELAAVLYRSAPLRFTKPTAREDKEIRHRFAEMKKGRSITMRPLKFRAANAKEEREMLKDLEDLRSGKVKAVRAVQKT